MKTPKLPIPRPCPMPDCKGTVRPTTGIHLELGPKTTDWGTCDTCRAMFGQTIPKP